MSSEAASPARRRTALSAALLLLASCSSDDEGDPAGSVDASPPATVVLDQGENNWALMEGPVIEFGDARAQRKQLELDEGDLEGRFVVDTPYLIRTACLGCDGYVVAAVQNDGADARCSIRAELVGKTADGAQLAELSTFLDGSSNGASASCLQPGETGYIRTIREFDYADVERVEVSLTSSAFELRGQGAAVPFDYRFVDDELVVDIENTGVEEVEVNFASYIFFNDDGLPVEGSIFGFSSDPLVIEPGGAIELSGFAGERLVEDGHTLWVATEFSAPDDPAVTAARSTPTANERERRLRQQRAARAERARRGRAR